METRRTRCVFRIFLGSTVFPRPPSSTTWPSGLRRCVKAAVRKGVGSNPTAVNFDTFAISRAELAHKSTAQLLKDNVAEWSKALR